MQTVPLEEHEDFPRTGYRARRFKRFERDLEAWLATPEGRFSVWHAQRLIERERPLTPSRPRRDP